MLRDGHIGAALIAYAPLGSAIAATGADDLALAGAVLSRSLAMLPDHDVGVPFLSHRGATHTLAFATTVGLGVGLLAGAPETGVLSADLQRHPVSLRRSNRFVVGWLAIGSRLVADALTSAGVPLLWPLSGRRVSLGLVPSDDIWTNYGLLLAGLVATSPGAVPSSVRSHAGARPDAARGQYSTERDVSVPHVSTTVTSSGTTAHRGPSRDRSAPGAFEVDDGVFLYVSDQSPRRT